MISKAQINRQLSTKIKAREIQMKSQDPAQPSTQIPASYIRAKSTKRARKRSTRKINVLQSEQTEPSLEVVPYIPGVPVPTLLFVKQSNTLFDQGTSYAEARKPTVCKKCLTSQLTWLKIDYDMEKNETLEVQACLNSKCKNIESKTRITKSYDPPSDSDESGTGENLSHGVEDRREAKATGTEEQEQEGPEIKNQRESKASYTKAQGGPKIMTLLEAKAYAKTLIASIPKTNRISEIKSDTRATQILSTIPEDPNNATLGTLFPNGIPVLPNGIYWNF